MAIVERAVKRAPCEQKQSVRTKSGGRYYSVGSHINEKSILCYQLKIENFTLGMGMEMGWEWEAWNCEWMSVIVSANDLTSSLHRVRSSHIYENEHLYSLHVSASLVQIYTV